MRNSIFGAWKLANVRSDVRQAATAAVQEEQLADWIRHENTLPMCVLGVAMLKAAAIKETTAGTRAKRERNKRAHSAKGTVPKVARKKKSVWRVDE